MYADGIWSVLAPADEFRSRCQTFRENTLKSINRFYLHIYLFLCMYLKSIILGNRISIMVCFVFRRLWQRCWKWKIYEESAIWECCRLEMDFWWYRNATTSVELCVFLSLSLFEGKKLKTDAFVKTHRYKFLENATVDFQFLYENIILL